MFRRLRRPFVSVTVNLFMDDVALLRQLAAERQLTGIGELIRETVERRCNQERKRKTRELQGRVLCPLPRPFLETDDHD